MVGPGHRGYGEFVGGPKRTLVVALASLLLLAPVCSSNDDAPQAAPSPSAPTEPSPSRSSSLTSPTATPPPSLPPTAPPAELPTGDPDPLKWGLLAGPANLAPFYFHSARAHVTIGNVSYEFVGLSENILVVYGLFEPTWQGTSPDGWVASCGHLLSSIDATEVVTVTFQRRYDFADYDYLSFASNGDGTVLFGLYDADTGEEWSGTGSGEPTIQVLVGRHDANIGKLIGRYGFSGTATEHYSLEKRPLDVRIDCVWAPRDPDSPLDPYL